MDYRLKNLLIIDIETASTHQNFGELPAPLQKHWERKAQFFRNEEDRAPDELYADRAAIYAEYGKVITIALGAFYQPKGQGLSMKVISFAGHDEKSILSDFKNFIETKFDPETIKLCAHNGKEFDFPYLSRRMLINGLALPYVLDNSGKKPWEVNFLDTMEMWKFGDRKNFTSLDLLTNIFEIPSSKSDLDGSMVNEVYYQEEKGLERIEKYCQQDVIATAQLFLKLNSLAIVEPQNIKIVT